MNVILVDDEAIVRKGIRTVIGRKHRDWQVVGEAGDGAEALTLLERAAVDVMITDIRMPDMDGLQLMEEVRRRGFEVEIVVLSSYGEFEYARRAVRAGAVSYLLKPVDPDDLAESIRQADVRVRERLLRQIEQEQAERQQTLLRQTLLTHLLLGRNVDAVRLRGELARLGWQPGPLLVAAVGLEDGRHRDSADSLAARLRGVWSGGGWMVEVIVQDRFLVAVVGETRRGDDGGGPSLDEALACLERERGWLAAEALHAGVGDARGSDLSTAFNQAVSGYHTAVRRSRPVVHGGELPPEERALQFPYALEQKLLFALRSGCADDARELAREFAGELFDANRGSNLYNVALLAAQTLKSFQRLLWERGEAAAMQAESDGPLQLPSIGQEALKRWFVERLERIVDFLSRGRDKANRGGGVIEQMKRIVQEEYHTDLQIRDIADKLYMNASYLSNLFKQSTGKTFTEYLIDVRLEKAKELLQQERGLKIYEIADRVGYSSPKHFSQLFKKHTGLLPGDYRL